jgi:hypothetical protein
MPEKNAFGTPSVGRAPKAAFSLKLPVSRDSSRSRKVSYVFLCWSIFIERTAPVYADWPRLPSFIFGQGCDAPVNHGKLHPAKRPVGQFGGASILLSAHVRVRAFLRSARTRTKKILAADIHKRTSRKTP